MTEVWVRGVVAEVWVRGVSWPRCVVTEVCRDRGVGPRCHGGGVGPRCVVAKV